MIFHPKFNLFCNKLKIENNRKNIDKLPPFRDILPQRSTRHGKYTEIPVEARTRLGISNSSDRNDKK